MQTLRPLVTGTDFSACAECALAIAVQLAAAARTGITLVHVSDPGLDDIDDTAAAHANERLAALVAKHRKDGVEITAVLRSGRPWEKLDNLAVEVGASVIVIGRHGRGGHAAELGCVARHLVRSSSRPVLTVSCDFDRHDHEANDNDH